MTEWRIHTSVRAVPLFAMLIVAFGCEAPRNLTAIHSYYTYDFDATIRELTPAVSARRDEQYILDHMRIGLAALAQGDDSAAESSFTAIFNMLSTAGLNRDRTVAAVLLHEGVRIWKGEPFEQALTYYWISIFYALRGDWDNARAAIANSLFRLAEFSEGSSGEYKPVESNFVLGYLMQGLAASLSGAPGRDELLATTEQINPSLHTTTNLIRSGKFDTVLFIDFGKGPTKTAFGPDDSLTRFEPQETRRGPVTVKLNGRPVARADAVVDVDQLAQDLRWNNFENVRRIKSTAGDVLIGGGAAALIIGANHDSNAAMIAGGAAILAGILAKAGAKADTRYLEFSPQSMYVVPVDLGESGELDVSIELGPGPTRYNRWRIQSDQSPPRILIPGFVPGRHGKPAVVYLRLHGDGSPQPGWLLSSMIGPVDPNGFPTTHLPYRPWSLGWKRAIAGQSIPTSGETE